MKTYTFKELLKFCKEHDFIKVEEQDEFDDEYQRFWTTYAIGGFLVIFFIFKVRGELTNFTYDVWYDEKNLATYYEVLNRKANDKLKVVPEHAALFNEFKKAVDLILFKDKLMKELNVNHVKVIRIKI